MSTDAEALRAAMQARNDAAIADIKKQHRANCSCWRQHLGEYPAL